MQNRLEVLSFKLYSHNKPFKPSIRYELIRKCKQRFRDWNPEERNYELFLRPPKFLGVDITVRFGDFVTQTQNEFSVEFEPQSWAYKGSQMKNHFYVIQDIISRLPGKKELYVLTPQGLVQIPVKARTNDYWFF